jgi:D-alanyl-D-alanine carboxypeptidase
LEKRNFDLKIQRLERLALTFNEHPKSSETCLRVFSETTDVDFYFSNREEERPNFIASTTKTMLSAIVLTLVEEKYLKLDDSLTKFLNKEITSGLNSFGGVDRSGDITIRHLLSNQSGIPNYYAKKALSPGKHIPEQTSKDPGWTFEEATGISKSMKAKFPPGTGKVEYSFTNFQILSEVVEVASGEPLKSLFQARLFDKLGMASSSLFTKEDSIEFDKYANLLIAKYPYFGAMRMASLRGEGAVVATTEDVLKFSKALFCGNLLTQSSVAELTKNSAKLLPGVSYGLGTMLIKPPLVFTGFKNLPQLIGHSGATGHFMFFEPETKTHFVGTVNQLGDPLLGMRMLFKAAAAVL